MHLQIVALEQRYDFSTKAVSNVLKAVLPTGRELAITISEEEVQALIGADSPATAASPEIVSDPPHLTQLHHPGPEAAMVAWTELSDDALAPWLKDELRKMGLPAVLPESYLIDVVNSLADTKAPWLQNQQAAPVEVERGVSPPTRKGPRPHSIESDESGNPIVPQRAQQHNDFDDDDTGVRSL